ncbi:uncharacterized protein LOC122008044 isoform X1 [Zingiber officinale]|uniref:uncharacterized protein LOC122008044 isoform X1 n=1 Tax=Zingiber officinale TaxID=94328 RepID=UPI001C4D78DD|nr:uncharacterized protein LOC122008044 isoform X1 [Zingiber officinale]
MQQEEIPSRSPTEQFSIEEECISSSDAARILNSCDEAVVVDEDLFPSPDHLSSLVSLLRTEDDVFSSSSAAVSAGGSSSAPPPCYPDDGAFSPFNALDAAALSALLDAPMGAQMPNTQAPDVDLLSHARYAGPSACASSVNLPLIGYPPPFPGDPSHYSFEDEISVGDPATSGYTAGRCQPNRPCEGEYYTAAVAGMHQQQKQSSGFVGMELASPCLALEEGGMGPMLYRSSIARGEAPRGYFFAGGGMMSMPTTVPEAGFMGPANTTKYQRLDCGLGVYGQEVALQHAFGSGDLQVIGGCSQHLMTGTGGNPVLLPAPEVVSSMDESSFKVGRLSVKERKEKINRYQQKRNQRNFSKKIKYACRKTLADSRPRVRGRFAKNDEFGEVTKTSSNDHEFEDEEEVIHSSHFIKHTFFSSTNFCLIQATSLCGKVSLLDTHCNTCQTAEMTKSKKVTKN